MTSSPTLPLHSYVAMGKDLLPFWAYFLKVKMRELNSMIAFELAISS